MDESLEKPTGGSDLSVLEKGAAAWGLALKSTQLDQFAHYLQLIRDWNQRMNLTAVDDFEGIQKRHFLDSLSCALVTGDLNGLKMIDVGSGAGFPGLPLKLYFPSLQLTLVESVAKKARFLQAVVAELKLEQVEIYPERAELLGQQPNFRESYDWAVARAVAPLATLAEYLLPFCRLGAHMLALKGHSAAREQEAASNALAILGGQPVPITSTES